MQFRNIRQKLHKYDQLKEYIFFQDFFHNEKKDRKNERKKKQFSNKNVCKTSFVFSLVENRKRERG